LYINYPKDESDLEYKKLTQTVSQQVFHINGNITSIEKLVGFLGTSKDTPYVRNKLHDVTEGTRELIKNTTNDIKLLSQYQTNKSNKSVRKIDEYLLNRVAYILTATKKVGTTKVIQRFSKGFIRIPKDSENFSIKAKRIC
jgi:uncharacterized protein (UPF0210 family)